MNIQQIKGQISIADFLSKEGITPTRTTAGQLAYIAPYRDEQDPSLIVNDKIGVWYDHGLGEGGRIIDLAMKIYQTTDVQEVVQRINDLYEGHVTAKYPDRLQIKSHEQRKAHELVTTKPLGNNLAISAYLKSRGVYDEAIKTGKVVEVYYDYIKEDGEKKRYFGAGWKNDSEGYDVRSKYSKICIDTKDMMHMSGNTGQVNVFEGMMNFLSALKEKQVSMKDTNIVLNSLSLSAKAISRMKEEKPSSVNLFLDNGQGGDKFTNMFQEHFPELNDRRGLYKEYEDYNDKIMADEQKKDLAYKR